MFISRSVVRICCSRHPRRYFMMVLMVASFTLLFWQVNYLHLFDGKRHNVNHFILQGPAEHDHAHVKRSQFSLPRDYIEIPDVAFQAVNTTVHFKLVSKATGLCDQAGDKCKGILGMKLRGSIVYILVPSLPTLKTGTHKLYLKSRFINDITFGDHPHCSLELSTFQPSKSTNTPGCKLPKLDPFDPSVREFMSPMEPMKCPGDIYTSYHGNVLKVVKKGSSVSRVVYQPIRRVERSDTDFDLGEEKVLPLDGNGVKLNEDFVQVKTSFANGEGQIDFHAHVAPRKDVLDRPKNSTGIPLNMIILGMDGNSDANVQRLLPDAYKFLKDDLKAFLFKGFSLLGEATTPQLTGMLTGRSVEENCAAHEARKGVTNAGTVDAWPFIFKTLKDHGYATMYSEDAPSIGAFHLRLNGFADQPCDHYGRYFWWAVPHDADRGVHENCINAQAQHMLQLNYLRSLITSYPNTPKFGFTFLGSLCHQSLNMVSSGARDIYEFLKSLRDDGHLNNTMLVVLGDHGARFEEIRATLQGKLEERLPFLSIALPEWFRRAHPRFVKNLKENTQRIISMLDLHATFMHILKYPDNPSNSELSRGTSLFEEISRSRECTDAGIPEHFCPCVKWKPVPVTHFHIRIGAHATMQYINKLLSKNDDVKSMCHRLELDEILSAVQEIPNKKIQLFKGIKDGIGLGVGTPMFYDDEENDEEESEQKCSYQIQFRVKPSMGLFESTVRIENGRFQVSPDISRVNRYGTQPECIKTSYPFLRKFCLCRH